MSKFTVLLRGALIIQLAAFVLIGLLPHSVAAQEDIDQPPNNGAVEFSDVMIGVGLGVIATGYSLGHSSS
jgi:hypothetical protein